MATVLDALRALGARVDGDRLPFTLHGTGGLPGGEVVIDASASSQFVSGLLLSGARYDKGVTVVHDGKPVPSLPHIDMTVDMLRTAGVDVDDADAEHLAGRARPDRRPRLGRRTRPVQRRGLPGRRRGHRRRGHGRRLAGALHPARRGDPVGARAVRRDRRADGRRDDRPGPGTLRGVDVDLHDVSELTPTVAAVAALADAAVAAPRRRRTSAGTRPTGWPRSPTELDRARRRRRARPPTAWLIRPAPAARRRPAVAGLRRPPDGHRGRADRAGRARASRSTTSACTDKTIPDFPGRWAALRGAEDEADRAARVRRVRRPGAARAAARARAPSAAPTTPTPSRRWSPRSTAAAGPAPPTATAPAHAGHRDAGPRAGPHPDRRRRPGGAGRRPVRRARTPSPGSCGSRSATTVLRRTADDNDPSSASWWPTPSSWSSSPPWPTRCRAPASSTAAWSPPTPAGCAPVLCLTKADLADPEPFAAQYARAGPAGAGHPPRRAGGRPSSRSCSPGGCRRWSGTRAWASRRWSTRWCRTPTGRRAGRRRRQGPAHHRRGARPAAARGRGGGWVVDTPGVRSFGLAHVTPNDVHRRVRRPGRRRSRTARAAAATSGRPPTRSARWTRWSSRASCARAGWPRSAASWSPCARSETSGGPDRAATPPGWWTCR